MDCSYWLYYRLDRLRSPSLKYSRQQYGTLTGPRSLPLLAGKTSQLVWEVSNLQYCWSITFLI